MTKAHSKVLALLIPNFCLFYAYAWPSFYVSPSHRESFGAPDLYLDIRYSGYPKTKVQSKEPEIVDFDGVLATDSAEHPIKGRRFKVHGNTWYAFYLGDQKFLGWLSSGLQGCEPHLNYRLEAQGRVIKKGMMKAGFCE